MNKLCYIKLFQLYHSYHLVKILSQKYNIDESHNHVHSKEVLFFGMKIMENHDLSTQQALMCSQCMILHDMIDKKYDTNLYVSVENHLRRYFSKEDIKKMFFIMENMSYSKTVQNNNNTIKLIYPSFKNDDNLKKMFHIVREADLLSSYNIARMIYYRKNRNPNMTWNTICKETKDLYNNRMKKLISNGCFYHKSSEYLAYPLYQISLYKIKILDNLDENDNLDILKIIDYLRFDELIQDFQCYLHRYIKNKKYQ